MAWKSPKCCVVSSNFEVSILSYNAIELETKVNYSIMSKSMILLLENVGINYSSRKGIRTSYDSKFFYGSVLP